MPTIYLFANLANFAFTTLSGYCNNVPLVFQKPEGKTEKKQLILCPIIGLEWPDENSKGFESKPDNNKIAIKNHLK